MFFHENSHFAGIPGVLTMLHSSRCVPLIFILTFLISIVPVCAEWQDPCPMDAQDELTSAYLNDRSNYERKACEYAAKGYCFKCSDPALSACNKYGITISCAPGSSVTPPPPKSDDIWIVIVGVVAVAGAVGGAVVLTKKKPSAPATVVKPHPKQKEVKTKEKEKEKKKIVHYILELSKDRLSVGPEKPEHLTVSVWMQEGTQPPQRVPEAAISLTLPLGVGLIVTPSAGYGELQVQVRTQDPVQTGEFPLTVTAMAGGSSHKATVIVSIDEEYVMRIE